jgi:carbon monoxide dehydrogenase subunit G
VELTHDFDVSVPVDEAWKVLTDVERIAPCLPGAQLQEVEGDEYRGVVKVKVGPISAQYKGKASFAEQDVDARRAVLTASGRDTRGQGNASATITAQLEPDGAGTRVRLVTDLTITGKVAQFGRGALADVSQKLLGQFVENLETTVLGADSVAPATESARGTDSEDRLAAAPEPVRPRLVDAPEAEPIDLLDAAGAPLAKRALPLLGVAIAVVALLAMRRRRRRRRG